VFPHRQRIFDRFLLVVAGCLALTAEALGLDRQFDVPASGDVVAAGASVDVRWTATPDALGASEQELVLSLDGGLTFPIRVSPEMSPRSAGLRWIVPDLPSAHARLAVRSGSGEASEDETLSLVSDEFTIVSSATGESSELVRGATEWWTRQALLGVSAEDLLAEAMRGSAEQLVVPAFFLDISEPDPPAAPVHRLSGARLAATADGPGAAPTGVATARQAAPLPLRL
jgi:hypothetical protein